MEVISINQLRVALGKTALQHKFVNDFFWGDIDSMRAWKERIAQYPLVTAYTTGLQVNKTTKIITLNIEVSDKMYKDWNINLNEIESDTPEILEDIFNALRNMPEWRNVLTVQNDSFTANKFINQTGDVVAGWRASINLKLIRQQGLCLAPFEDIEPTPPFVCADGTVRNSDGSFDVTVPSGGELELEDITVTDSDGTTREVPAMTDVVCKVIPSGDGFTEIKDEDENIITTLTVPPETTVPFTVPNSIINVDNHTWSVLATDTLDLEVIDDNGFAVPTTQNGNQIVVDMPPCVKDWLVLPYNTGDIFAATLDNSKVTGTVQSINSAFVTNLVIKKNGVVVTAPFTVADIDKIEAEFDAATSGGAIVLDMTGTFTFQINVPWYLTYLDTRDVVPVVCDATNTGTYTAGTGTNVGSIKISTDNVTYTPMTFPFTPIVGQIYYFKRSNFAVTGTYLIG